MKKINFITFLLLTFSQNIYADSAYFIDFTKLLNSSKPGAEAQKKLQDKFQTETKRFKKIEEDIRKEESEIISQKKILSPEEYKKKVEKLREKVNNLQKNKQSSFSNIAKSRNKAKKELLKAANPIVKKYMEDNKIRMVIDKKGVIMGDTKLEITDQIIAILNDKLPSVKIK